MFYILKAAGMGENISTKENLHDSNVCVGDVFRVGEVLLQVTEPRVPCTRVQTIKHTLIRSFLTLQSGEHFPQSEWSERVHGGEWSEWMDVQSS